MPDSKTRALLFAAAVVGWKSMVAPRLTPRWQAPVHAALGAALAASTRAPLGLRPPEMWRGLRWGAAAAGVISTAVAASTAVPAVRAGMRERELPDSLAAWLLVRIPIGTVWSEEAVFRGALGTVTAEAFGPAWGRVVQAGAFGASHVADARGSSESVLGTVVVTAAAGWGFGWLYDRSGSLAAPMLAHLAVNESGALAALAVRSWRRPT